MSQELDALLGRVQDPALREDLRRQIDLVRAKRSFGLVFESHLPERVRLPSHPVRRGSSVVLSDGSDERTWTVDAVRDGKATLVLDDDEPVVVAVSALVVVAEFGEPVYPGLRQVGSVRRGGDKPAHVVINGENHHALEALQFSHAGKVDCIYIDPPYNTGNKDWIYSDRYISDADGFRHSKWLSFIERRLLLARGLLKPTGVILVAIGDDEHHHLRMLMDQVFGEANFISDVVWQGGRKNDSRYVSNGADYMLIYARDEQRLSDAEVRWREEKPGVDVVLDQGAKVWEESGGDMEAATAAMRAWFKSQGKDSPVQALSRNVWFLPDGTLCRDADTRSPNPRPNLQYDLLHPVTGKPCRMHPNGWVYSEETMHRMVAEGRIIFRATEKDVVSYKRPLADTPGNVAQSVFERLRTHASRHLENVLGDKRFPYPKDHEVLMRWFSLVAGVDGVFLDFFAGSGSSAEAVIRLNVADGGTRQCVLVTNNEVSAKDAAMLAKQGLRPGDESWEARGVFENVTKPRVETVVSGVRPDGSPFSEGLEANVEFLALTYQDGERVELDLAFEAIAPLLWLRAGATGPIVTDTRDAAGRRVPYEFGANYAVLFNPDRWRSFIDRMTDAIRTVFIVTDSATTFATVAAELPTDVEPVRLYRNYLSTFEINRGLSA